MSSVEARKRFYARHHQADTRAAIGIASCVEVPADVTVLQTHVPCFRCGVSGGCRHRPWLEFA
jgi:hypothetical protein